MNVEPEIVGLAIAVMTVAALVQASVGFGANMLAAPTFALLDPDLVPGPIFLAAGVLTFATAIRERDAIEWPAVGWATAGRIPGAVLGAIVLARVTDASLQLLVAITILVAVAITASSLTPSVSAPTLAGAGAFSGFGATTAAIGGPPLALVLSRREGPVFRSTMGAFFAFGTFITIPAIAAAGRLGRDELIVGSLLVPGALVGFALSGPVRPFVDRGRLRPLILLLATAAALALIIRVAT